MGWMDLLSRHWPNDGQEPFMVGCQRLLRRLGVKYDSAIQHELLASGSVLYSKASDMYIHVGLLSAYVLTTVHGALLRRAIQLEQERKAKSAGRLLLAADELLIWPTIDLALARHYDRLDDPRRAHRHSVRVIQTFDKRDEAILGHPDLRHAEKKHAIPLLDAEYATLGLESVDYVPIVAYDILEKCLELPDGKDE